MPTILLNGIPVPYRPFTLDEKAPLDRVRDACEARGWARRDTRKDAFLFMLAEPVGGDDITVTLSDDDPRYDGVWVRFPWHGSTGNMRIIPAVSVHKE